MTTQISKRVLVCGGRDYNDRAALYYELNRLIGSYSDGDNYDVRTQLTVITGAARGADTLADEWAMEYGAKREVYPADWAKHKKAAGPIRNQQMLDEGKPSLVIAFPGGAGTADMVRRAKAAGIAVIQFYE